MAILNNIKKSSIQYKDDKIKSIKETLQDLPIFGNILKSLEKQNQQKQENPKLKNSKKSSLEFLKKNNVLLTQISDNFYNIAGHIGAQTTSLEEVKKALESQQAIKQEQISQPQAVPVNKAGSVVASKQKSLAGLGILAALGATIAFGSKIIDGMIEFFKNPFEFISSLLSSLGEGISEFFEEGGFKDFIMEAFEEGKKELVTVFEDLKDIFKIIISNPVANLMDDIKVFFIDLSLGALKKLPDWLKGDTVKNLESSLEKSKEDIKTGKEERALETDKAKASIEERRKPKEEKTTEDQQKQMAAEKAPEGPPPQEKLTEESEKPQEQPQATPVSVAPSSAPSAPFDSETQPPMIQAAPSQAAKPEADSSKKDKIPKAQDKQPTSVSSGPTATGKQEKVAEPTVSKKQEKTDSKPSDAKPVKISSAQGKQAMISALDDYKVNDPTARAAIMAQVGHESGNFTTLTENLNYKPQGLLGLFKKYFGSKDQAEEYSSKGPPAIADRIYGGRMGNAPEGSGEGFLYRGRGFIQLTGKSNYKKFGYDSDPDKVAQVDVAAETAMKFILGYKGDWGDVKSLTKFVNGGTIGLADREKHFQEYLQDPSITQMKGGTMVASAPTTGAQTSSVSADVNAAKKQQGSSQIINVNNSSSTAIKVGAAQGGSSTVARPIT